MAPATTTRRKRTLLNFNQLAILQRSFAKNPLPDNAIRAQLAIDLGVTERTVQIWFQNRRAKTRKSSKELLTQQGSPSGSSENTVSGHSLAQSAMLASQDEPIDQQNQQQQQQRRSLPNGGRYQPTFRTLMTPERYEELRDRRRSRAALPSNNSTGGSSISSGASTVSSTGNSDSCSITSKQELMTPNSENVSARVGVTLPLMAHMLRIGTWTRFAQHTGTRDVGEEGWDLACEVDPFLRRVVWQIQVQDGSLFRMQVPFEAIHQIRLSNVYDDLYLADLEFHLFNPALVVFTMLRRGIDLDWILCSDFSEDYQASQYFVHVLQGRYEMFQQALFNLIALVPELTSMVVFETPPVCRDTLTLSPSATPEPYIATSAMTTAAMQYPAPIIYQQDHQQLPLLSIPLIEKPLGPEDLYLVSATPYF